MQNLLAVIGLLTLIVSLSFATSATAAVGIYSDNVSYSESTIHVAAGEPEPEVSDMPCEIVGVDMHDLLVRDMQENVITVTRVGSQVVIEATVTNICDDLDDQLLLVLFEVRDEDGLTRYLTWQNSTIDSTQEVVLRVSWLATQPPGDYLVRGFNLTCLNCPMVLSGVQNYSLKVLP